VAFCAGHCNLTIAVTFFLAITFSPYTVAHMHRVGINAHQYEGLPPPAQRTERSIFKKQPASIPICAGAPVTFSQLGENQLQPEWIDQKFQQAPEGAPFPN
jgi:hypothetical protein